MFSRIFCLMLMLILFLFLKYFSLCKCKVDFKRKSIFEHITFFVKPISGITTPNCQKKTVLKSVQKRPRKWHFLQSVNFTQFLPDFLQFEDFFSANNQGTYYLHISYIHPLRDRQLRFQLCPFV